MAPVGCAALATRLLVLPSAFPAPFAGVFSTRAARTGAEDARSGAKAGQSGAEAGQSGAEAGARLWRMSSLDHPTNSCGQMHQIKQVENSVHKHNGF